MSVGALQNAVAKPINRFEYFGDKNVCNLAASLIFGLAKGHAFEQGNKRTAFKAGLYFIECNGFGYFGGIESAKGMELGLMIIELCENKASEDQIAEFLKNSKYIARLNRN